MEEAERISFFFKVAISMKISCTQQESLKAECSLADTDPEINCLRRHELNTLTLFKQSSDGTIILLWILIKINKIKQWSIAFISHSLDSEANPIVSLINN